ncbi:MAG: hypothetical protein QM831_22260 [Kofleriaceae bacterium]
MLRIALFASIVVGCASDDSRMLTGHWDLANCTGGVYSNTVSIRVAYANTTPVFANANCQDLSFTMAVPGDFPNAEVTVTTGTGGVFDEGIVNLASDHDLGLITFVQGPLQD